MDTATETTYRASKAIPLSAGIVALTASLANALIAWAGLALGAPATGGILPMSYITLTVIAAIAGAVGWHLINRYARRPRRVLTWLVPTFLVVSFVPDILVGISMGWILAVTLMIMHVATLAIGITVYARLMRVPEER
ncbi:hypothetical protein GCM10017608_10460 [Agromyces luteolus]|uniref:Uncharacterized protein n=1 Tax=Agromyces luteolus TaxID=88373 RepID=A0A7C9M001_9MICO|nr:DUF6069 family protein [Agromyces luteolus]MUN08577.1 hypothetical protein [Agromyces luteolus]GLK27113.1 hypothetical protein GCM10017608_10460 [Agromyces luteolus]